MFSSGPNYTKLKTNLRLGLNRLKLLEKKKAELAQKARKEIADYLATGKIERARIRVEHIIREDYLVEAMEIVEMYCDLLLARFGLVTQMKELDVGIAEAVSSVVWVCPRLQSDVPELKVISDIFIHKYGPQFAEHAHTATGEHQVSEKLMHKLQLQAPPKLLVEKYLIEIAKNYNVEYEPDPQVMKDDSKDQDHFLIDLSDKNNLGGGGPGGAPPQMGFIGYPSVPPLPTMPEPPTNKPFNYPQPFGGNPSGGGAGGFYGGGGGAAGGKQQPFNYPQPSGGKQPFNYPQPFGGNAGGGAAGGGSTSPPFAYNIPPNAQPTHGNNEKKDLNTNFINEETNNFSTSDSAGDGSPDENLLNAQMHDPPPRYSSINPYNLQNTNKPKPQPRSKFPPPAAGQGASAPPDYTGIPNLPNVPADLPDIPQDDDTKPGNDDDIDFDDLSRRFENLKKRK